MIQRLLSVLLGCLAHRAWSIAWPRFRSKESPEAIDISCPEGDGIRIACAGSSITHGGFSPGAKFPAILQELLGDKYVVRNLGVIGKTITKGSENDWPSPYWFTEEFKKLSECKWDIVVLTLGTSDASEGGNGGPPVWNHESCDTENVSTSCPFWAAYDELIKLIEKSGSPEIFLTVPPPVTRDDVWGINQTVVNAILPKMLPKLAEENLIRSDHVIDLFTALGGDNTSEIPADGCNREMQNHPTCRFFCDQEYCDQVHPIISGKQRMAEVVKDAILEESEKVRAKFKSPSENGTLAERTSNSTKEKKK